MAKLSKAARAALPRDSAHFLVPSKAPGPGSYPIPDAKHRAIAKGLAGMHGNKKVEAKAERAIEAHGGHKGHGPHKGAHMGFMGGGHHNPDHHSHGLSHAEFKARGSKPISVD